jgi:hypothetical protein
VGSRRNSLCFASVGTTPGPSDAFRGGLTPQNLHLGLTFPTTEGLQSTMEVHNNNLVPRMMLNKPLQNVPPVLRHHIVTVMPLNLPLQAIMMPLYLPLPAMMPPNLPLPAIKIYQRII